MHNRKHLASSHFEKDVPDWSKALASIPHPRWAFDSEDTSRPTDPVTWQINRRFWRQWLTSMTASSTA